MLSYLFGKLEPRIQALVTDRILMFYRNMIEKGQIPEVPGKLPRVS